MEYRKSQKSSWIQSDDNITTTSEAIKTSNIAENYEEKMHSLQICERQTQTTISKKPSSVENFQDTQQVTKSKSSNNIEKSQISAESKIPLNSTKHSRTSWKELRDSKGKVETSENSQNLLVLSENLIDSSRTEAPLNDLSDNHRDSKEKSVQPDESFTKNAVFDFDNIKIKCYERRFKRGDINGRIERVLKIVSGGNIICFICVSPKSILFKMW